MDNTKKRPLDNENDDIRPDDPKKSKVAHELTTSQAVTNHENEIVGIGDLCDDIILQIFKFLSNDTLANMALVNPKLSRISKDWTLWKNVHLHNFKKSMENIYLDYLQSTTTSLTINGNKVLSESSTVSRKFIMQLENRCPKLTHLSLSNQIFFASEIPIRSFHRKLKSLTIENSCIKNIPNNASFICGLNHACPDLENVKMTFNNWFRPHGLYALAKLEKLTYLSLQGCSQFMDCIPYVSITAMTGFKSLQSLDLRLTPITDHELICFQKLSTLKHIFLESPLNFNHEGDTTITDLGLSGFCNNNYYIFDPIPVQMVPDHEGQLQMRIVDREYRDYDADKCQLETLYVRNYPKVTDVFMKDAAEKYPFLTTLDVTGTSCTVEEIGRYKIQRPDTKVVWNEYLEKTEK
ncbi:F-box domain,Leucine-rich repeat domain, L domain-like [Cinara cedri]|uniref:F-box domain,Leucine-rich repeat domain, L domain-like n=1 Tax=Cinara cedri TaxID=506608 RepID=A0A5E4NP71_9HEMI|nr:F-box domain,Leucine-rich repeat domain, L domain-like [Cinara cedri]